jgi:hypothetical protein
VGVFPHQRYQKVTIAGQILKVNLSQTEKERSQGFSGVKKLAENEGMLFILPQKQIPSFWMKAMNFPLDFIWISDQKVVDLTENVLPPKANHGLIATAQPRFPCDKVLEVNAGFIKKHGIKIGDKFSYGEAAGAKRPY